MSRGRGRPGCGGPGATRTSAVRSGLVIVRVDSPGHIEPLLYTKPVRAAQTRGTAVLERMEGKFSPSPTLGGDPDVGGEAGAGSAGSGPAWTYRAYLLYKAGPCRLYSRYSGTAKIDGRILTMSHGQGRPGLRDSANSAMSHGGGRPGSRGAGPTRTWGAGGNPDFGNPTPAHLLATRRQRYCRPLEKPNGRYLEPGADTIRPDAEKIRSGREAAVGGRKKKGEEREGRKREGRRGGEGALAVDFKPMGHFSPAPTAAKSLGQPGASVRGRLIHPPAHISSHGQVPCSIQEGHGSGATRISWGGGDPDLG